MNSSVLRNPKKRPQVATHGTGANTKAAITVELPEVRTAEQKWANAGQIMSVFCSEPRYRDLSGQVLYFKLMLALALGQYAILRKSMRIEDTEEVMPGPVGAIHWAKVSEQLHQQFLIATDVPRLDMSQWDSGSLFGSSMRLVTQGR